MRSRKVQNPRSSRLEGTGPHNLPLLLSSCVTLGKFLNLQSSLRKTSGPTLDIRESSYRKRQATLAAWGPPTTFFLPLQPICKFSLLFRPPLCPQPLGQACCQGPGLQFSPWGETVLPVLWFHTRAQGGLRKPAPGERRGTGSQGSPQLSPLRLVSICPASLTPIPPGTSVAFLSGNRLRALLASVPRLLFQKPALGCGEDTGKMAPDLSRKVPPMVFMGKGGGSREDLTAQPGGGGRGRRRTPFSSRLL